MRPRALAGLLAFGAVVLSGPGDAQHQGRVLHRPIPGDLPIEDLADLAHPVSAAELQRRAGPDSAWRNGQPLGEQVLRPIDVYSQEPRSLDRDTRSPPGARLETTEVFTPALGPFKRLRAYDTVDEMARLSVRDPSMHPLVVGENAPLRWGSGPRARFVGEVLVELSTSVPTLIPGVAGEQRVISYNTNTNAMVEFTQDSAGNLFVRGTVPGVVRLTYVIEAPESAFQLPRVPDVRVAEAAAQIPLSERPLVPSWLHERAAEILQRTQVSPNDRLVDALSRLIMYFRSFRDADLPDPNGPTIGPRLYSDLALGGVGACRHRAFGLMPTLHALGLPARYVGNEAHAWVEVFVSGFGWTRLDLGGWNIPLETNAPSDRPAFQPANADPFPQPANYTSGYSYSRVGQAGRARSGERNSPGERAEGREPNGEAQGTDETGSLGEVPNDAVPASGADGNVSAQRTALGLSGRRVSLSGLPAPPTLTRGEPAESSALPDAAEGDNPAAVPTTLTMLPVRADASGSFVASGGFVRGSMVLVEGEVRDDQGRGVGGLAIQVHLVRGSRVIQALGTTVSQPGGHWEAHVLLPSVLDPGMYSLRATTPGDARHAPASGE